MKWVMLVLIALTSVFMIVSFVQDIRERTVFSFPCFLLTDAWAIVLWNVVSYRKAEIICFLLAHSVIYTLMRIKKIWGEGDSDVFLLFANVCMVMMPAGSLLYLIIDECLAMVLALIISLAVGAIEYKVKGRKLELKGDMAVIPGFSVVMIGIMALGAIGRIM